MTSPTRKPLLILPIEERKREFLSRILIALEALECGAEVLLGQQWRIFENIDRLPPGVILFKGNNVVQATSMAAAKRAGHFVCSIEEELFAVMDAPAILRHYAPLALESCDIVFTQSANQRDVLSTAHGSARPKLKIVGNPRVDVIKQTGRQPLNDASASIREELGPFILINTNFGSTNPISEDIYGGFELCVRVGLVDIESPDSLRAFQDWVSWERLNFDALLTVCLRLAETGQQVVLRPHPSENSDIWFEKLQGVRGIQVRPDGDQVDWLRASQIMVHPGSTTGLEAFLLGRPALSLTPKNHPWNETLIPNIVNPTEPDPAVAVARIAAHLSGTQPIDDDRRMVLERLHPYLEIDENRSSAQRIIACVADQFGGLGTQDLHSILSGPSMNKRQIEKAAFTLDDVKDALGNIGSPAAADLSVDEVGQSLVRLRKKQERVG